MQLLKILPILLLAGQAWTAALPQTTSNSGDRAAPVLPDTPALVVPEEGSGKGTSVATTVTLDVSADRTHNATAVVNKPLEWSFPEKSVDSIYYSQTITFYDTGKVHLVSDVDNYNVTNGANYTLACGIRDDEDGKPAYVYIVAHEVHLDPYGGPNSYENFDRETYNSYVQSEWSYINANAKTMYCRNANGLELLETAALTYRDLKAHGPTIGGYPILIFI